MPQRQEEGGFVQSIVVKWPGPGEATWYCLPMVRHPSYQINSLHLATFKMPTPFIFSTNSRCTWLMGCSLDSSIV